MTTAAHRVGPRAQASVRSLLPVLQQAATQEETARLQTVNLFFNRRVAFLDDLETWGQVDHWTSPIELLGQGQGDCEDYAIAKYFSLAAAGVPVARLRLVYVRAQLSRTPGLGVAIDHDRVQAHMVLAYYGSPDADPLILDNLISEIRPASRRPDLVPVFSFNSEGLWQGVGQQGAGDPLARLSRWREVLAKARDEGFSR